MNLPNSRKYRMQDLSLVFEAYPCIASVKRRQYSLMALKSSNENAASGFSRPFSQNACQLFAEMGSMTSVGSLRRGAIIASRI